MFEYDRQLNLFAYVNEYAFKDTVEGSSDSLAKALSVLSRESSTEMKQILVGHYISRSQTELASSILSGIPIYTDEDQHFADLMNLYIHLINTGKSVYEMDSLQIDSVRTIANYCPETFGKAYASSLLKLLFEEEIEECEEAPEARKQKAGVEIENLAVSLGKGSGYYLGNNIPNPFYETTRIPYRLPEGTKNAKLIISNIMGTILNTIELDAEKTSIDISMKGLSPGIYIYTLQDRNYFVMSKKMIIIQ